MTKFKLNSIVYEITPRCNLSCIYCYNHWKNKASESDEPSSNITYKQAKKTLKRLFRVADIKHVSLSGGEPFLFERLEELVLFIRLRRKNVNIITNGFDTSKERYQYLHKLGVSIFELPIHSYRANEHDAMTKTPTSWERSTANIEFLLSLGATVVPVLVITKKNVEVIDKTLHFIHSLGIKQIMLNRYNIGGNGMNCQEEVLMDKTSLNKAFEKANVLAKELKLVLSSNVCTPHCVVEPKKYPNIYFTNCSPEIKNRPLTLDTSGNIRFCNHSPEIMGNIYEERLEKIIEQQEHINWFKNIPEICNDCKVYKICLGGCRAAAMQYYGDPKKADPIVYF